MKIPNSILESAEYWNIFLRCHNSSMERFSENFDKKAVTYLIFFIGTFWVSTSASSEGAQGFFSKIIFSKSVRSNEKDEVCHSFLVKIFTKSLHRGGVRCWPFFYSFIILNPLFKSLLSRTLWTIMRTSDAFVKSIAATMNTWPMQWRMQGEFGKTE